MKEQIPYYECELCGWISIIPLKRLGVTETWEEEPEYDFPIPLHCETFRELNLEQKQRTLIDLDVCLGCIVSNEPYTNKYQDTCIKNTQLD